MSGDDELDPDAQRLVEMARHARSPTEEQRERAYQALMATVGGGAAVGAAKAAAAKSVAKSSLVWLKWAIPAALVGSAGIAAYALRPAPNAAPPAASSLVAPAPSASAVAPEPEVVAAPVEPVPSSASPVVKPPSGKPVSSDDMMQDIDLLHDALAASRAGNASKALQLARQHQSRYPNSRLRIEREAIEVRSLCSLGRTAEARKIAERVRARAPSSPVSAALAETCAGK